MRPRPARGPACDESDTISGSRRGTADTGWWIAVRVAERRRLTGDKWPSSRHFHDGGNRAYSAAGEMLRLRRYDDERPHHRPEAV